MDATIVDIRTEEEWKQTGVIPNSKKITFFNQMCFQM
jgi:rhodanese-related sulfurtransferase